MSYSTREKTAPEREQAAAGSVGGMVHKLKDRPDGTFALTRRDGKVIAYLVTAEVYDELAHQAWARSLETEDH